jgi:hypothetical protein
MLKWVPPASALFAPSPTTNNAAADKTIILIRFFILGLLEILSLFLMTEG